VFQSADERNTLDGWGAGVFVPLLFLPFCLTAEKYGRDGLAHIFLFCLAGRKAKLGYTLLNDCGTKRAALMI